MNIINIIALEEAAKKIFSALRDNNISEVLIEKDSYWEVSPKSLFGFSAEPVLEVGSIKDDLEFLNSYLEEDQNANYLEFEKVAIMLKIVSTSLSGDIVSGIN